VSNRSGKIRIKTQDLLHSPEILREAKTLCERVCLERDMVLFEPKTDYLVTLVVMISKSNISYSVDFVSMDHDQPVQAIRQTA
jgi:hypothetical protein